MAPTETPPTSEEKVLAFLLSPIEKLEDFLEVEPPSRSITTLINALHTENALLIGQIFTFTKAELARVPNVGKRSLEILESLAGEFGLQLGQFKDRVAIESRHIGDPTRRSEGAEQRRVRTEQLQDLTKQAKTDIERIVTESDLWPSDSGVKVREGERGLSFVLDPNSFIALSLKPEFVAAAARNPTVRAAVASMVAGFALAAQTKTAQTNPASPAPPEQG